MLIVLAPPAEQAMKARKEIADYIKSGRIERARIRVSQASVYQYDSACVHVISWSCGCAVMMSRDLPQVEHIIREDYLVEAMEVIELYCDLLLARFGMLEAMR